MPKLAPSLRDSICEQCHLEGEVRVLNPGRDWWNFQAGQATENVFVTYMRPAGRGVVRAVSQREQLAQSQCARQSGNRLWCGTCHNPHASEQNRAQSIQQVCLSCHRNLLASGRHPPATAQCVSCHMPKLRPTNVAHASITDHRISRKSHAPSAEESGAGAQLKAWREPDPLLARRDLGLAYFDLAASTHDISDLQQAYQVLSQLPAQQRQDPAVKADLGSLLLEQGHAQLALRMFADASAQEPSNARYAYCLGVAHERAGEIEDAVKELRRSIGLDPSQPDAYLELAQLYKRDGRNAESREALRAYLRFMPENVELRLMN